MHPGAARILTELSRVFDANQICGESDFTEEVARRQRIVTAGAGRVGLVMAGYAKRLKHLGKESYWIEDKVLPRLGVGDLFLVGSGSGETETMVTLAGLAQEKGMRIALVTSSRNSRLSQLADTVATLNCPNKLNSGDFKSSQPMTSLFEQALQIFLDSTVLDLMQLLGISEKEMRVVHNELE